MLALRSIVLSVAIVLAAAAASQAQPLLYWGRAARTPAGWIQFGAGEAQTVEPGVEIPAWGRVKEVHDDRIVVERAVSEAEKQDLEARGALVYDVLEIHILREDLRQLVPMPPTSRDP
jgi:hypothetical protein